jgi:hypothetical protein
MALPPNLNQTKLSEAALAILGLSAFRDHQVVRAWKGMDWDLLDVLYQNGWIVDPKGKAKSVIFTDEGARLAQDFLIWNDLVKSACFVRSLHCFSNVV